MESTTQCDSGLAEEAELQWREERMAALDRCKNVKHVFQRVARDSPDVIFLQLEVGPPPFSLSHTHTHSHTQRGRERGREREMLQLSQPPMAD